MTEFTLRPVPARISAPEMDHSGITTNTVEPNTLQAALARPLVRKASFAIAGSALVALCAHISLPLGFTPVPFTLQPFAILLLSLLLEPAVAFATLTLYLIEGACGMPVFSPHGPGGIAQLLGPTGGYLMAAPFAAMLASLLSRTERTFGIRLLGAAVGDIVLLLSGAAWLGVLEHASLRVAFAQGVTPFLISDSIKVVAAALCASVLFSFTAESRSTHAPRSTQAR